MNHATIIGCVVEATAPRRRTLRGVVLPPKPRGRSTALRIAVDGHAPARFDPAGYTVTVIAGPDYSHGNLPAEHLATATMLKTELRKFPAAGQPPIATYAIRKGAAHLYAVADAADMPALSDTRAEAWATTRTCVRCHELHRRPLEASPEGDRYCVPCHQAEAVERWHNQARAAQADAAAWAREILADPNTFLLAADQYPAEAAGVWWQLRAETPAGEVLADARILRTDETEDYGRQPDWWTPERIAEHEARREGTVGRAEIRPTLEALAGRRVIMWRAWGGRGPFPPDIASAVPAGDQVADRLALWSGWTWGRHSYWYPTPSIPWGGSCNHPAYRGYEALLHGSRDLQADIAGLRALIHGMADGTPPEPSVGLPTASVPR